MRCPKCNCFFSEELKVCPKCGNDMGEILERIGVFPLSTKEPFLSPEDFKEKPAEGKNISKIQEKSPREIEFSLPEENEIK